MGQWLHNGPSLTIWINDRLFCSKTLVSDMRRVLELLVPIFFAESWCLFAHMMPRARGMDTEHEMDKEHFANPNLRVVVAKCVVLGFVVWDSTSMSSLFTTAPTKMTDVWLFTSINGCRAGWGCVCLFPVCGWFEWPSSGVICSTTTNRHGVEAFVFTTVSGCNQLVVGRIYARSGTIKILVNNVAESLWIRVNHVQKPKPQASIRKLDKKMP